MPELINRMTELDDMIELNGNDLCRDPLEVRKTTLATRSYFREVATGAFTFR
jgi:hypothetical protein